MRTPAPPGHALTRPLRLLVAVLAGVLLLGALPGGPAYARGEGVGAAEQVRPGEPSAAAPGTIAGTVRTPDGAAVDGVLEVYRWDAASSAFVRFNAEATATSAPSPWSFSRALPEGSYYPRFRPSSASYLPGYAAGATAPPTSPAEPGVVRVTPTSGADATVVLRRAAAARRVTGVVRDPAGTGLEDITVETDQLDGEGYAATSTEPDGSFTLLLAPGTWEVRLTDEAETYAGATTTVTVAGGDVTLPPTVLTRVASGRVTGRVLGRDGAPVGGAEVELHALYDTDADTTGWEDSEWIGGATTDAQGRYAVPGSVPGSAYTVGASAPGHLFTALGGVADVRASPGFVAASGTDATTTAPDLTLADSSRLTGLVTSSTGTPAPDVEVLLSTWDEEDHLFYVTGRTTTGSDGRYRFETVAPGTHAVRFVADPASLSLDSAWLVGTDAPAGPEAPGTLSVGPEPGALVGDRRLPRPAVVTGLVEDADGTPVADAAVAAQLWVVYAGTNAAWEPGRSTTTGPDGRFRIRVPRSTAVTVRAGAPGRQAVFLGGATSLPASPTAQNSVDSGSGAADADTGPIVLPTKPTSFGAVAGQERAWCRTHALPLTTDADSGEIPLPATLPVRFGDVTQRSAVVNGNGTLSFGSAFTEWLPTPLADVRRPLVAAFWADWDPRPNEVAATWGLSPDGETLCALWSDGGYFLDRGDKLNTVQLLVRSAEGDPGRAPGDVDLTLNYDRVLWDSADSAGGRNGRGGTSAVVGWTDGLGAGGTTVEHPGSLVNDALLDTRRTGLVRNKSGSVQNGRYVYEVRNTVPPIDPTPTPEPTTPVLVGSGRVDEALRVDPGTWGDGAELGYQWLREDGPVAGATGSSWTPSAADLGHEVSVQVVARRNGSPETVVRTDATRILAGTAPTATTPPRITGDARVGRPLRVDLGRWDAPTATLDLGVAWLRDGEPVPGATRPSWTPSADDLGAALSVEVTATRAGHEPGSARTDAVVVGPGELTTTQEPRVVDESGVQVAGPVPPGTVLRTTPGAWDVTGAAVTTIWLRDGRSVPGTAGSTFYEVTAADAGRALRFAVTATSPGYADARAVSAAVDVDRISARVGARSVRRSWAPRSRPRVRVAVGLPAAAADLVATGRVLVRERGRVRARGRLTRTDAGRAVLRLPRLSRGRHRLVVSYLGDDAVREATGRVVVQVRRR